MPCRRRPAPRRPRPRRLGWILGRHPWIRWSPISSLGRSRKPRRGPHAPLRRLGGTVTASLILLVFGLTQTNESWFRADDRRPRCVGRPDGDLHPIEYRSRSPLVPLGFFRRRTVTGANLIGFGRIVFGMFFLLSLYMQQVLGYSALETARLPRGRAAAVPLGSHRRSSRGSANRLPPPPFSPYPSASPLSLPPPPPPTRTDNLLESGTPQPEALTTASASPSGSASASRRCRS